MSEQEKEKDSSEKKNLETVDFTNKKDRIQTAHSKQALNELGLDENKLYRIEKEEYLLSHPELKNASDEIKDKRYDHYEQRREEQIELAKKRRKELIEKEENKNNKEKNNKENDDDNEQSEAIKKELEKLEMMKKQQLGEIKNIIDYAYKMEEFRKKNQEKMRIQEEKEEKLREEKEKQKKEKEELQKKRRRKKRKS